MCNLTEDCNGSMSYDTCMECGARLPEQASMRTNIHLPSEEDYRRQKEKLFQKD